jgi:hypothetical protein
MMIMVTFDWAPDSKAIAEGIARFQRTGGQPPAGVKLLGRWTRTDFGGGFALLETDDPKALTEFALSWSDIMSLTTAPVVDDQSLSEVLARGGRP